MNARLARIKVIAQYSAILAVLGFALSAGLTACGKKSGDSDQLKSGSLVSDGNGVSSTSTLAGYQLSFSIQSIQAQSSYGGYNSYGSAYSPYSNVLATLTINGQSTQLNAPVLSANYASSYGSAQANSYVIYSQAACYTQTCSDIGLAITIMAGNSGIAKQVLIKKNLLNNKIVAIKEWDSTLNNSRSVFTMMAEVP